VSFSPLTATLVATAILGGIGGLTIAYAAWQRRETRGGTPFALYALSASGWMLSAALLWTTTDETATLASQVVVDFFAITTLLCWAVFVVVYTGTLDRVTGWIGALVAGWAAVLLFRIVSTPLFGFMGDAISITDFHGLTIVAREPDTYMAVNLVVALGLLVWTFVLLGQFYRSEVAGQRRQAGLIFLAAVTPAIVNVGYRAGGISVHEHLDPTPLFFITTVVGTWFALFKYDFLEIQPIAARRLFETMADPVIIVDNENTILNTNASAEIIPLSVGDHIETVRPLQTAIEREQSTVTLETAAGDERVFDLSVSPIAARRGRRGRLIVLRDITIRIERERQLERQNEQLESFTGIVSHDLRNPLNVAAGNLTLLEETADLEYVHPVRRSLGRMETIVDDLLVLAQAGQLIESTTPVRLDTVAHTAWAQVETDDDVTLSIELAHTVEADRDRLLHIFENCFRNAVDHNTPPLTIRVEPLTATDSDRPIGFAIADDGTGIPPDERDQIFEHGYTTATAGTGFGLTIARDIAAAHGWEITVTESAEGGARFEIRTETPA